MARQRKLMLELKAFINSLLEYYQGMLEAEIDQKLVYSKYDYQNKATDEIVAHIHKYAILYDTSALDYL